MFGKESDKVKELKRNLKLMRQLYRSRKKFFPSEGIPESFIQCFWSDLIAKQEHDIYIYSALDQEIKAQFEEMTPLWTKLTTPTNESSKAVNSIKLFRLKHDMGFGISIEKFPDILQNYLRALRFTIQNRGIKYAREFFNQDWAHYYERWSADVIIEDEDHGL